jgi:serine/threonine protein kinase
VETLVGITISGYTLTRVLGSGGMGTVYLAEDKAIGQQVAIKVIRTGDDEIYTEMISKEQAAERFRQEARAVASLDHLHILPLYRYGEEETAYGRQAYMVMQYRPEGSLMDWQKKRAGKILAEAMDPRSSQTVTPLPLGLPTNWPLDIEEAADYLMQAASALQYAHDHGIIHRDIKPANFLLRFDTNPATGKRSAFLLLSDFGLAKFYSSSGATSSILGTPIYMAPEQFNGNAGPGSDQYALAVMIYYLLAGRPPFMGDPIHLLSQHLNADPPPIRTFIPTLPAGIEQALARALAKNPSERYPSVSSFAEDFMNSIYKQQYNVSRTLKASPLFSLPTQQRAVQGNSEQVLTQPSASSQPFPSPIDNSTVAAFSQADYAAPTLLQNAPSPIPSTPQYIPPSSPAQSLQTYSPQNQTQLASTPSPSPSSTQGMEHRTSRRSALGWLLGGITVIGLGIGAGIELSIHESSHQGKQPANSTSTLPNNRPQSSTPTDIKYTLTGHSAEVTKLSWSPNGTQLASASQDYSVRLWDLATQQNTLTYTGHTQGVLTVAWSHNNQLLASGGEDHTVLVWDTAGNTRYNFPYQPAAVEEVIWTPNDQRIIVDIHNHRVQEIVLSRKKPIEIGRVFGNYCLALSPNGQYLAVGTQAGIIAVYDTKKFNPLVNQVIHRSQIHSLAWSPDSTLLASGDADSNVQVMDITTQTITDTLPINGLANDVSWEPSNTGQLAVASSNGTVIVWNTNTGSSTIYRGHQGPVTTVAWGNKALASGSTDKTIIIWNI